MTHIMKLCGQ